MNHAVRLGVSLPIRPHFAGTLMGVALGDAVGELSGALRTVLGLTRRNRLRDHIRELTDLHSRLEHAELAPARRDVADTINHQAAHLKAAHTQPRRKLNWGSFIVGMTCTVLALLAMYGLWPPSSVWRSVTIVVIGLIAFLFLVASIGTLVAQESDSA